MITILVMSESSKLFHISSTTAALLRQEEYWVNFIMEGPLHSHPQLLAMCTTSTIAASRWTLTLVIQPRKSQALARSTPEKIIRQDSKSKQLWNILPIKNCQRSTKGWNFCHFDHKEYLSSSRSRANTLTTFSSRFSWFVRVNRQLTSF